MSKYNYDKLVVVASKMIDKFGRDVIKRSVTSIGSEWNPSVSNVDVTISAVSTSFKANEVDGTLILATDKLFLTYTEVTTADSIVDGTDVLSVVNVVTINPGEVKLIYKVQCRK